MFYWIKRYMPSGLYGRVTLILLFPVILLQLLVSVVFVQRHFEGVTEQMTAAIKSEIILISQSIASENMGMEKTKMLLQALNMTIKPYEINGVQFSGKRRFYDLTGIIVRRELLAHPNIIDIDLPDDYSVRALIKSGSKEFILTFPRKRVSASNPHQLIVNMIIFGAIFAIVAFLFMRNQLRPITRLAQAAEAFGLGKSLNYRPTGAVEVRAAGQAFLDMRSRIERNIEQRTLLLSGVSHDLRTPLTRLRLGISLLKDKNRELLEKDAAEMQALIDEFLSFTRSESDANSNFEMANVSEIIKEVIANCERAGGDILFDDSKTYLVAKIRPLSIKRAIENIVSNGMRYASKLKISVSVHDEKISIDFDDNGGGISEELYEEALKPFSRLDPSRNQNKGSGVGLGLPISSDIAKSHGGFLELGKSDKLGGLKVRFVIDLKGK